MVTEVEDLRALQRNKLPDKAGYYWFGYFRNFIVRERGERTWTLIYVSQAKTDGCLWKKDKLYVDLNPLERYVQWKAGIRGELTPQILVEEDIRFVECLPPSE